MKFEEYILELSMKKGTDIKIIQDTSYAYHARITLDNGEIFKVFTNGDYMPVWVLTGEDSIPVKDNITDVFKWEVYFEDDMGKTELAPKEKGTSLQLFAALEQYFKDFIKKKKPDMIEFSSDKGESSRMKLYNLLSKKIQKGGYTNKYQKTPQLFSLIKKDILKK